MSNFELLLYAGLFVAGFFAAIINTLSGGGSFLTIPLLIFTGLDPVTANGTNRVGILLQGLTASGVFQRAKIIPWQFLFRILPVAITGALLGSFSSILIGDVAFKRLLSIFMGTVTIISFFYKSKKESEKPLPWYLLHPAFFLVGVYGGFIQAGVGYFILFVMRFTEFDLRIASTVKNVIVLFFTIFALMVFLLNGRIVWGHGLVLGAGSIAGATIGAHLTVRSGNRFLQWVILLTVLVLAVIVFFY